MSLQTLNLFLQKNIFFHHKFCNIFIYINIIQKCGSHKIPYVLSWPSFWFCNLFKNSIFKEYSFGENAHMNFQNGIFKVYSTQQLKLTFIFKSVISILCPCDRNLEATTDFPNLSKQFCSQDKKCFDGDPKAFSNIRIA